MKRFLRFYQPDNNKHWLNKTLLIMKFSVFLSFIAILSVLASGTYSQNTEITLNLKSSTVEQVLQEIEKNSEFFFLYNSRLIDVTREVTLDIKGKKITTILDELFAGQEIDYIVKDRQIILSPKNYDKFFDKSLLQEGKIIRGNVVSDDNKPLPGVNVMEEGTLNGTTTDLDGNFTFTVSSPDAILVFSFVGYITEKFPIGLKTQINVSLSQDFMDLEEIVVIGYGTVKKKDLTGAIASVKSGDIVTEGSNTAVRALQGKMAGVDIESSGGSPGARNRVLIRGISTVNNGRTDPLYILDGVPVDNIDNILPSDIESIDVLKDASAAAIYGARASNGVVLVTTKLGKKGESRVDIKTTYGWQKLIKKMDVLNSEEWAKVNNAAHDNDETPRLNIADNLPVDANGNIIDTKWQDEIYQVAPVQSYELSASGGGDFYTYSLSGGYYGQEGIVKMTNYDRLNLRLKSEYKKNRIRIGESVLLSNEKWRNMPDGWGGQGGNPVGSAAKMIPAFEVYSDTATGGFAGAYGSVTNVANPVAQLHLQEPKDEYNKIILNLFAELEIFKGLKYKYNIGYSKTFRYTSTYTYKYYVGSFFSSPFTSLYEGREQNNDFLQEHTLNYDKAIGKLSIHALAGFTFQKAQWKSLTGTGLDLPAGLSVMDAAKDPQYIQGRETEFAYMSYLGRIIASWDERYLLTGSFRRDGSSRFGKDERFGDFPSIALGWNVSNEAFFSSIKDIVSIWKLRASYGVLGNQNIPDYAYSTGITLNDNYVVGADQHLWNGAIQTNFAAKDIMWERAATLNIGTDIGLLENRISLTADYFIKKNSQILLEVPIPISTGASNTPLINMGELTNKGIELTANYRNNAGELYYDITGTFTHVKNKMIKMGSGIQKISKGQPTHHGDNTTLTEEGEEVGSFYLIMTDGIFNSQEEIDAYTGIDSLGNPIIGTNGNPVLIQPNAQPGDIKFIDANRDGRITDADRQIVGSAAPKFECSFNVSLKWKGIDFILYVQGTYGNKIYNGLRQDLEATNTNWNYSQDVLNYWTPENHTDMPRPTFADPNQNNRVSDRFLEDGSYARIKTLQIGYSLPGKLLNKIKISNVRIFGSVDNLYTFTKYKGYNPDLGRNERDWRADILARGVDYGHVAYPLPRIWLIGIQVSL